MHEIVTFYFPLSFYSRLISLKKRSLEETHNVEDFYIRKYKQIGFMYYIIFLHYFFISGRFL